MKERLGQLSQCLVGWWGGGTNPCSLKGFFSLGGERSLKVA